MGTAGVTRNVGGTARAGIVPVLVFPRQPSAKRMSHTDFYCMHHEAYAGYRLRLKTCVSERYRMIT